MTVLQAKKDTKIVDCSTNLTHRFRYRRWLKIVLQSGTGMRIPDEFVIVHQGKSNPIDAYLDEKGEVLLPIVDDDVEVEFPSLYRVELVESLSEKTVPQKDRVVSVEEGTPVEGESSQFEQENRYFVPAAWNNTYNEEEDDLQDDDEEWDLAENDLAGQEEEEQGDDEDEIAWADQPAQLAVRNTPVFSVSPNNTYVFELQGRLDLKLSWEFFRCGESVDFELFDEDEQSLIKSSCKSQSLSFPSVGVDTYRLKLGDRSFELESTQLNSFIQYIDME